MSQSTVLFPQTRLLQVCEGLNHLRFLFELAEGSFLLVLYFLRESVKWIEWQARKARDATTITNVVAGKNYSGR